MRFPVFDLHCDTAFELLGSQLNEMGSLRSNQLHIDLTRGRKHPAYVQCFACFTSSNEAIPFPIEPETIFSLEKEAILSEIQKNSDLIGQAYSVRDIEDNCAVGRISAILTIEGTAGFGYDPAKLESLYNEGFRITTLGWNENNVLTGSHKTKGGLTQLGREYVKEAQRLGMIVDVSHISDAGFWDIMDITTAPVIASHSNSRSVWDVSRNLTDDMFLALCKTGGVAGINLYADFLGENADIDTVCDHILHFLFLDPSGKHIALGGDLDGCEVLPTGFSGIQDYQKIAECLLTRGVSEETVYDIYWNNAFGVIKRCCI